MSRMWTRVDTESLILHVEGLPELWDLLSADYKDKVKKTNALENLAVQFDTSAAEIKRKLHNLRTQLHNELRKLRKRKSERGSDGNYNSTWEFFETIKFMIPPGKANETWECLEFPNESQETPFYAESVSPAKFNVNKLKKEDKVVEKALEIVNKLDDDAQIFGNFVASSIRNLRSEEKKRLMKRQIQAIVLKVEQLDDLDHATLVSSPVSSTVEIVTPRRPEQSTITYNRIQ
ncbi:uncharacterized protein [Tenebrio molitor]|uniref:uncharacterized protein n=1 Tax=Tenebrio molitor TaxID=7067 RepID=UPI0036246CB8